VTGTIEFKGDGSIAYEADATISVVCPTQTPTRSPTPSPTPTLTFTATVTPTPTRTPTPLPLLINGGPTLAGGGEVTGLCTTSGNACTNAGATVTCSGLNPSAFQNLYYGLRNDSVVDGVKDAGTAGPVAGVDQFMHGSGSGPIVYTGSTTIHSSEFGTLPVNTRLLLTMTSITGGTASVVATGGNPLNSANGDIDRLFLLSSGVTGFTLTAQVQGAVAPLAPSAGTCPVLFDVQHTSDGVDKDVSHVDLGFYFESLATPTPTEVPSQTPTGIALG
jgi:hypothetical protein